jgi:imidazolonepropionase-like amidohydrolase
LAGTDAGANEYSLPGFSLHDELVELVEAGLTPMEALQTATLNPARYLGLTDALGTVEMGKIADLVLLEANPLEDIHNTQKIAAVVVNGSILGKPELQWIFASALQNNSRARP